MCDINLATTDTKSEMFHAVGNATIDLFQRVLRSKAFVVRATIAEFGDFSESFLWNCECNFLTCEDSWGFLHIQSSVRNYSQRCI